MTSLHQITQAKRETYGLAPADNQTPVFELQRDGVFVMTNRDQRAEGEGARVHF